MASPSITIDTNRHSFYHSTPLGGSYICFVWERDLRMKSLVAIIGPTLTLLMAGAEQENKKAAKEALQGSWVFKEVRVPEQEKKTKRLNRETNEAKIIF